MTAIELDYLPTEDGITHINIYSKGKTQLGRDLSHFADIAFVHPKYGRFSSIEGFWYWLKTGLKHDELKTLYGFKAKLEGKKYENVPLDNFLDIIEEALVLKLKQNLWLYESLKNNKLPLTHYYVFGQGLDQTAKEDKTTPWLEYFYTRFGKLEWGNFKDTKPQSVIIAGSREITDYKLLCKSVLNLDINIKQIISGGAKGVDTLARIFALDRNIKFKEFLADWDKEGKAAGYNRNVKMSQNADILIALWNGQSPGTKNMIEIMKKEEKVVYVVKPT